MKAILSKSSQAPRSDRRNSGRSIVYVESILDKMVDSWFWENNVKELPFRSKTWDQVKKLATKKHRQALKELFPEALSISYSAKAGCSCGCSPGYIVKHESNQYGKSFWVDIQVEKEEEKEFASYLEQNIWTETLKKEKMNHSNPDVA